MRTANPEATQVEILRTIFGGRLQLNASMERYCSARVGGPADALLEVHSEGELVEAASRLWETDLPFIVLGGGSNVLISDAGLRGVVIINRARQVHFDDTANTPQVLAGSGVNMGTLARLATGRGLSGLEWAASVPGTVGGAVVGNAGAHGGDMAGSMLVAEILQHREGTQAELPMREQWPVGRLEYGYRSSILKHPVQPVDSRITKAKQPGYVVLNALFRLESSTVQEVRTKLDAYTSQRRRTQPPGASMGSMFKNPPGNFAGRLIEMAGLKGSRIGQVEISTTHGNFFINQGGAKAKHVRGLIELAREEVERKFGIYLELEIELIGEWDEG